MIKTIVIYGEEAVRRYEETAKIPSKQWIRANNGAVLEKEFDTLAEYNAIVKLSQIMTVGSHLCCLDRRKHLNEKLSVPFAEG